MSELAVRILHTFFGNCPQFSLSDHEHQTGYSNSTTYYWDAYLLNKLAGRRFDGHAGRQSAESARELHHESECAIFSSAAFPDNAFLSYSSVRFPPYSAPKPSLTVFDAHFRARDLPRLDMATDLVRSRGPQGPNCGLCPRQNVCPFNFLPSYN